MRQEQDRIKCFCRNRASSRQRPRTRPRTPPGRRVSAAETHGVCKAVGGLALSAEHQHLTPYTPKFLCADQRGKSKRL